MSLKILRTTTLVFLLTLQCSLVFSGTAPQAFLTSNIETQKAQTDFSAYEKIYIILRLREFSVGSHGISIQWINPDNVVARVSEHTVEIDASHQIDFYSWLKLMKKGPVSSALSGDNFSNSSIGQWQVIVYIGETKSHQLSFTIHN